jgi:hypothetical protein
MVTKDGFCFNCSKCSKVLDFRKYFVLFDTNYHPKWLFTVEQHDILRDEIISTILHHSGTVLFIKPHPRQDLGVWMDKIKKYDTNRVIVRDDPATVLAENCIPIILGTSTVALDCLVMGSVPIEYVRNESKLYNYVFSKELKFVYVAHNPNELVEGVKTLYGFNLNQDGGLEWKYQ